MPFEPLEGETPEETAAREARVNEVLRRQWARAGEVQETEQHKAAFKPGNGWEQIGGTWVFTGKLNERP